MTKVGCVYRTHDGSLFELLQVSPTRVAAQWLRPGRTPALCALTRSMWDAAIAGEAPQQEKAVA